jgi:histidyl-tRNA synthetase
MAEEKLKMDGSIPKVDSISGYREFTEGEATTMKNWKHGLSQVYEKYGFSPIENRPVERVEHLLMKGGLGKEIYGLCRANDG